MPGYVILGNSTEVGKTSIACQLVRYVIGQGLECGAFKPAASGPADESSDVLRLSRSLGDKYPLHRICPYTFEQPIAPILAAEQSQSNIDLRLIWETWRWWREHSEFQIVETAGGILSPLTRELSNAEFASQLGLPAILVVKNELGAINQAFMSCLACQRFDIPVSSVIFNQTTACANELAQSIAVTNIELFRELYPRNLATEMPHIVQLNHHEELSDLLCASLLRVV